MPEIFNPVDDLIAEQALVDALVADFTEDDWNRMASYCTTWTFQGRHLPHRALRLLRGGAAGRARRERERRGRCGVRAGRALPRHGVSRPKRRRHPDWWREQRTLMTASFLELGPKAACRRAAGIPPMSVRSLASARLMELWAHSVDLYDALGVDPVVNGAHHVHAVPVLAGPSEHVQREWPHLRPRGPDVP